MLDEAGHFHTTAFERAMAELDTAEAAKVGGLGIGVGLGLTLTLPLTLTLNQNLLIDADGYLKVVDEPSPRP